MYKRQALESARDVLGQPRTQVPRRHLPGLQTHPVGDVIAVDHEVGARGILATHQEVHMRLVGVVVSDSDPVSYTHLDVYKRQP